MTEALTLDFDLFISYSDFDHFISDNAISLIMKYLH